MKEPNKEDLANHFGHESYADDGNVVRVATAVVYAGKLLSSVPHPYRVPTLFVLREGKMFHRVIGKRRNGSAESKNLSMRRNFNRENRETIPAPNDGQQPSLERSVNTHGVMLICTLKGNTWASIVELFETIHNHSYH